MIVARGGKRGKTSGRGGKGQTARAGNKRRPEWRDIIKKLPKLRGRGRNSNLSVKDNFQKPTTVDVIFLEVFNNGDVVTPATLVEKGVIATWSGRNPRVKIVGNGTLSKSLKVSACGVSDGAKAIIEKAGGSVTAIPAAKKPGKNKQAKKAAAKAKAAPAKAEKSATPKAPKAPKADKPKTEKPAPADKPAKSAPKK
jgi:large subunit ribosomal protein L15